jgi:hypothetical protein
VFPQPLDFYSAETACVVQGRGAPQAHLVQIASYDELNAVKRLCRAANTQGNATSSPTVSGCWIGLHIDPSVPHDPLVDDRKNYFTWTVGNGGEEGGGTPGHVAPSLGTRDRAFRDWRRYEPNNRTVSEGSYDRGGEDCVEVVPWDHDPMVAATQSATRCPRLSGSASSWAGATPMGGAFFCRCARRCARNHSSWRDSSGDKVGVGRRVMVRPSSCKCSQGTSTIFYLQNCMNVQYI